MTSPDCNELVGTDQFGSYCSVDFPDGRDRLTTRQNAVPTAPPLGNKCQQISVWAVRLNFLPSQLIKNC